MSDISLTASMRSNLLSLQSTQSLMDMTQERLSTGKKVNSAIDNPSSYYTAQSLNNRASDLSSLLDSMGQGVQTIKAATQAIESITSFAQQAKSLANSARDIANNMKTKLSTAKEANGTAKTAGSVLVDTRADMSKIELTAVAGTAGEQTISLVVDGKVNEIKFTATAASGTNADAIAKAITDAGITGVKVTHTAGEEGITIEAEGKSISIVDNGTASGLGTTDVATKVAIAVGDDAAAVAGKISANANIAATVDENGKISITAKEAGAANVAGNDIQIAALGGAKDVLGGLGGTINTRVTDDNAIAQRNKYIDQFNAVLTQIDQLAKDAGYKGINLLQENDLKVIFNEDRSSTIDIKGVDASSKGLGLEVGAHGEWNMDAGIDAAIESVDGAISELRSMASDFGNNYSIVQNREDFTENLVNVLTEGADKLTLADMNEESANMLALQTRQQLAINSLSLASQAAQSVLKLF